MITSRKEFKAAVAATVDGKPLVIYFSVSSSLPCRRINDIFIENIVKFPNLTMKKVEINENSDIATDAGIRIVPTFKVYKSGVEVEK